MLSLDCAPLDHSHWQAITADDRDLQQQIADLFQEQATRQKQVWQTSNDPKIVLDALHTLRGSAMGIGAFVLAQHLGNWEKDLFSDTTRTVVEKALDDVLFELHLLLKD
jgi:hypothetical protein